MLAQVKFVKLKLFKINFITHLMCVCGVGLDNDDGLSLVLLNIIFFDI